jgi:hypothetical protein
VAKVKACVAEYGLLIDNDTVPLARPKGSGYRDGQLSLPAGHLDGDESAQWPAPRALRGAGDRSTRPDAGDGDAPAAGDTVSAIL